MFKLSICVVALFSLYSKLQFSAVAPYHAFRRVSQAGLGEQGNIGKISKGTREHEPILGNRGTKLYKLEDKNILI